VFGTNRAVEFMWTIPLRWAVQMEYCTGISTMRCVTGRTATQCSAPRGLERCLRILPATESQATSLQTLRHNCHDSSCGRWLPLASRRCYRKLKTIWKAGVMSSLIGSIWAGALVLLVTACSSRVDNANTGNVGGGGGGGLGTGGTTSCAVGAEFCACYGNDTCNSGLACASHLCVRLGSGGSAATGGTNGSGGTIVTSGTTGAGGAVGGTFSTGGKFSTGGSSSTAAMGGTSNAGTTGGSTSGRTTGGASSITLGGSNAGGVAGTGGTSCTPGTTRSCYSCPPTNNEQFLNACSPAMCRAFDNTARGVPSTLPAVP
jgi:hypothetical protein